MPVQTAPATITVVQNAEDTVLKLKDISDSKIVYYSDEVAGAALSASRDHVVLTITRRPPTKSNPASRFEFTLESTSYDALNNVSGRAVISTRVVKGPKWEHPTMGDSIATMAGLQGLVLNESLIQGALADFSWFR